MSVIIDKIKNIPNLYCVQGCSTNQIHDAQIELGIDFPKEYADYVKEYGAISFYGTEWTGLNLDGYINVVNATKQERELNTAFPSDCFVLENQGIDGLITVMDKEGIIYSLQYDKKEFWCKSLVDYLDICTKRNE